MELNKRMEGRMSKNLLDMCIQTTQAKGGTIHEYLPRLKWHYEGRMKDSPVYHLMLDDKHAVAWTACLKKDLPKITPHMNREDGVFWHGCGCNDCLTNLHGVK
jgi:hypothetical protein